MVRLDLDLLICLTDFIPNMNTNYPVFFLLYTRVWVKPGARKVNSLDCIQFLHDTASTPLLPPDLINDSPDISFDRTPRSTRLDEAAKARDQYNLLRKEKASHLRQRQFVFGAIYDQLFPGYFEVDAMFEDYNLNVTLPSKKSSTIRIRLVSPYDGIGKGTLLTSLVELGRTLSGPGNCRGKGVGDLGSMHAIGLKSASSRATYVTKDDTTPAKVETSSRMMTDWMQDHMRDVLAEIRKKDQAMKVEPPPSLKDAPGSRMMISVNLANSPHYDTGDTSVSVAIWVEEKPGRSENWYFILPNLSYEGSQGVVVKLMHGLVISWDGRDIFHCTSLTNVGVRNKVYGCLWSSCRE